ncbi:MAG: ABC transporter permease [Clostridiales bacterium]|nr:ABC transporter permease [Clostridiales bacterium]
MIVFQSMKMAFSSIKSKKLRSFLTMLGIIIGVFALVVLVSLVSGATGSIKSAIDEIGTDMVIVDDETGRGVFSMEYLDELRELPSVDQVAPVVYTVDRLYGPHEEGISIVYGTTMELMSIQGLKVEYGRFIMKPDVDNHTNVVVISNATAVDLLGRENVVGETLSIGGRPYRIIGVLKQSSALANLIMYKYQVYIPITSAVRISDSGSLSAIPEVCFSGVDGDTSAVQLELEEELTNKFGSTDEFYIFNQSEISSAMDKITAALSLLLGGIAAISLLVGGIGIMNIMLVSVTERTREIGIRKAIGARPSIILLQFLIEAMTLSLIGCIIGLILSWLGIQVVNIIGNVDFSISIPVAMVAVIFSSGVGILFGLYPAKKAAAMKPIDALRYN